MTQIVYFTLSHFVKSVRDTLLSQAGYNSLVEYEVMSHNPLFEICWSKQGLFEEEASAVTEVDDERYVQKFVPLSYLKATVKQFLFERFISQYNYESFDEYYLEHQFIIPPMLVYIPRNYEHIPDRLEKKSVEHLVEKKPLSNFTFTLNKKTNNSYILKANDEEYDRVKHIDNYKKEGWELFKKHRPIYYKENFGGFIVSKSRFDDLKRMGAKFVKN